MNLLEARKLLAIGSGVGIEIGSEDLTVAAVRARPSGARLLGSATIAGFRGRAAAEWGAIYSDFLKRAGAGHLSATVLLPRHEVIVRLLSMPGVADRDLAAAIEFQIDSLHPFPEGQAVYAHARMGEGGAVLVAIARRDTLDRYVALFAEAGVKVSSFTFSGAVLHSAARLVTRPPAGGFVSFLEKDGALEAYGESGARAIFSATFDAPRERAVELAASELRLEPGFEPIETTALLPAPKGAPQEFDFSRNALAYAAALAGACPRLALPVNLLPKEFRVSNSRVMYVPAAVLALAVVACIAALAAINPIEDRRYMRGLEAEIRKLEPLANRAGALDKTIEATRARTRLLDDFRRHSKADLETLEGLTKLIEPPAVLNSLELTRNTVTLGGAAEQASALLKLFDGSSLLEGSRFVVPITRQGKFEAFRVRAARKGAAR
ncbi:MAG: hypothetical protein ACM336_08950 [Acidobacteriota bacterium]